MTIRIGMTYIGRNGHEYPCWFSPEAVREHWKKGHGVHLYFTSSAGDVNIEICHYPLTFVSVHIPNRQGYWLRYKQSLNGLRTADGYSWWC